MKLNKYKFILYINIKYVLVFFSDSLEDFQNRFFFVCLNKKKRNFKKKNLNASLKSLSSSSKIGRTKNYSSDEILQKKIKKIIRICF
jgi:hypothetical protein